MLSLIKLAIGPILRLITGLFLFKSVKKSGKTEQINEYLRANLEAERERNELHSEIASWSDDDVRAWLLAHNNDSNSMRRGP